MAFDPNDQILLEGITMDHSFACPAIVINRNVAFSFQAVWTGTAVGNWILESSCDSAQGAPPTQPPDDHFQPIITSPTNNADGSLQISWSIPISFNWIRLRFAWTSGTGQLTEMNFNGR